MKKSILLAVLLMFAASFCFAQQPQAPAPMQVPVKPETPKPIETKDLAGKVESVSVADSAKGTKSEIVVVGDKGEKVALLVKGTTTIYDAAWKPITLDKIMKDEKVSVKYITTKEGLNEARTVNVIK